MSLLAPHMLAYWILALLAFAANSVLCRLALSSANIDPASFTAIRLLSGAVTLVVILLFRQWRSSKPPLVTISEQSKNRGSWAGALSLFVYAVGFSYAYIELDTGTGALILFASVQFSMIAYGLFKGERLNLVQWCGLAAAFAGLLFLLYPTISTPTLTGALLMLCAGLAWGIYSILGKQSQDALSDTAFNFARSTLLVAILAIAAFSQANFNEYGLILAIASGALASGIGYAIWYSVLPTLSAMSAAVSQLTVPIIAALGGLIVVNEGISLRLVIASVCVLGGVFIVLKYKTRRVESFQHNRQH
ncbi:DMT family transporter [Glaciecola siphonariae]|uniref:DMT family transporter n=1 Tax=Glaciecola siphonariae TaxID=521012 RepID=A0ABV9LXM8_9ALTE